MSVKAQPEKGFRRAKVKPVKKRPGRLRMALRALRYLVPALLAAYAAYLAIGLVFSAPSLRVRRIAVTGNSRLSGAAIQSLMEGLNGTNIMAADLGDYRERLMRSPWVADAALRRVLPSTIEVFISERRPIGLCRLGPGVYLLDRTGTIIDEFGPQYQDFDLPLIDGVVRRAPGGNSVIDERRTALAASVIDALAPHKGLASRVSQIDVTDVHDAVVLLDDDAALLHVGTERFVERLTFYLEIAPALRERVQEMDYVDLRFDDRAYVRPVGGTALHDVPAGARATSGQRKEF